MNRPYRSHYGRSKDERLRHVVALTNMCCGTLKEHSKELRNAFYDSLASYNYLFEKEDRTEEETDWMNQLFVAVKFLGSRNDIWRKEAYIKESFALIREIFDKIGLM